MEDLHGDPHNIAPSTHDESLQDLAKRVEDVVVVVGTGLGVKHFQTGVATLAFLGKAAVVIVEVDARGEEHAAVAEQAGLQVHSNHAEQQSSDEHDAHGAFQVVERLQNRVHQDGEVVECRAQQHDGFQHFYRGEVEADLIQNHILPVEHQQKNIEHVPRHLRELLQPKTRQLDKDLDEIHDQHKHLGRVDPGGHSFLDNQEKDVNVRENDWQHEQRVQRVLNRVFAEILELRVVEISHQSLVQKRQLVLIVFY